MRIGVRAHDFGKRPAGELAAAIVQKGLTCVQLTLEEAITDMDTSAGRLNAGMAAFIGDAFRRCNLQIAVLSCYINPVHPDPGTRRSELERFKEFLRFARDFGCGMVATETGSVNGDMSFDLRNHSEELYRLFMESLGELVAEAEKFGVFVGIEGVERFVIHSPRKIRRMLDDIRSNHVQIVFDPVNLLSVDNHGDRDKILRESFELFGDRVAAFHAKDYVVEDGEIKSVQIGEGWMNYGLIGGLLKSYKPFLNVIMEDVEVPFAERSLQRLKELFHE